MRTDLSSPPTPMDAPREPGGSAAGASRPVPDPEISAPPSETGPVAAAPAWFSRKKASDSQPSAAVPQRGKPAIALQPVEKREMSLSEKIVRWVVGFAAIGYATSFLVHLAALLILSFVVYTEIGEKGFSVLLTQEEGLDTELDDIDTRFELAGGADAELEMPQLKPIKIPQDETTEPRLPTDMLANLGEALNTADGGDGKGKGSGTGDGVGDGTGLGFAVPQGGKVVTKGSFTAWTVPADPAPGQNYLIVIQIELPDDVRRFPKRDLIGSIVIGTDGYRQEIPGNPRGFLPMKERQAQMVIPVPGAANLVRDTIQLQSKLLKEKQTLQIVF